MNKDKIQICNWLLTRRCNLKCSYCAITRNYKNKPIEYPDMKYYHKNEMSTEYIINGLKNLKLHNPNCFNIFYGGEPFLRDDLADIINFCNKENIYYTIISNNSPEIQPKIESFFKKVDIVYGFTGSVDPVLICGDPNDDRTKKSRYAIEQFSNLKSRVKDLVAEMTVSKDNIPYLFDTIKYLTELGVSTDLTYIDISKNDYYDFSNIHSSDLLVSNSSDLKEIINSMIENKFDIILNEKNIEMAELVLPSNYDCKFEDGIHNITIDADGSLRTCLRISGIKSHKLKLHSIFTNDSNLKSEVREYIVTDKKSYCEGCNWTCVVFSKFLSVDENVINDLGHLEKRGLKNEMDK